MSVYASIQSQGDHALYDPSVLLALSFGVTSDKVPSDFIGFRTAYFHTLCEQGADDLGDNLKAEKSSLGICIRLNGLIWVVISHYKR